MERFDMEKLYEKAGGIFRLTVLVQKRLKQLNAGAMPLVDSYTRNLKEVVFQEILEDRIALIQAHGEEEEEVMEMKTADSIKEMFQKKESAELPSLG